MPIERAAARAWLDSLGQGPKVGLTQRSGMRNPVRNIFATDLQDWARLQEIEGLKLVNLQFGNPQDEIREAANARLFIHEMPDLDTHNDLDGTAALTSELDFATGLWNAAAEMTGALGVPGLFYMPAHHPMQIGTGTLPWHPTLQIYPGHARLRSRRASGQHSLRCPHSSGRPSELRPHSMPARQMPPGKNRHPGTPCRGRRSETST